MPAASRYDTVAPFGRTAPASVPESAVADRKRVVAYETYEDIYTNVPTIFLAVLKEESGNEELRRLIPSARTIVEATNRYFANGLTWVAAPPVPASGVDPAASEAGAAVADESVAETMAALDALFKRERFNSKFTSLKRWMLIRGDAMLHVTADPTKDEGSRLTIREINPSSYFAIEDPADAERVIGVYLVNVVANDEGEEIVARLEYRRMVDAETSATYGAPLGSVFMRMTFWELDGWDDRASDEDLASVAAPARFGADRFALLLQGMALPPSVKAIPVYHFPNGERGGDIYGTSEIQGIETLILGINQTATDQELAIALQGLGLYWTDSGRPKDSEGNDVPWMISPATMLELDDGKKVGRLDGIGSITPSLEHMAFLGAQARETTGTPDIAVGAVDVKVAESGVSRAIQFAPVLAKNAEKEETLRGILDQFLFDLVTGWLPAYEGYTDNGTRVTAEFGPALPVNAKELVELLVALVKDKVVSAAWARQQLTARLGYAFAGTEGDAIVEESQALIDAAGARLDAAVADGGADVETGL